MSVRRGANGQSNPICVWSSPRKKEIADLCSELADASISCLIKSIVLEGLSFFGETVKSLAALGSFRDALYLGKLARFVQNLDAVPEPKHADFRAFLKMDSGEKQRLGRIFLSLLEQLSDVEKADLMAMAFIAYLDGTIDSEILRRLWDAISHAFPDVSATDYHWLARSCSGRLKFEEALLRRWSRDGTLP
jgi:hypothetical protein